MLLLPGFGGGLSFGAHLVRWGSRTTPLGSSAAALPPNDKSALELIHDCLARKLGAADSRAPQPWRRAAARPPTGGVG